MTQKFIRYTLCIICTFLCSINAYAWRGAKAIVKSEPANGGYVYVSSSNSTPSVYDKTDDNSEQVDKWSTKTLTFDFYRFCLSNNGYVFKGWADSNSLNSGVQDSKASITTSTSDGGWVAGYPKEVTYYAIFARLTADKSSLAYSATTVGQSAQQTITITHAHAGKITANISGDNASDYSVSSTTPVANSVSEGAQSVTITFVPTCNGTRTATLTLHSDNGLNDVVITLTGEGTLNPQTLTWDNEPIDPNMTLGSTLNISATATSALPVTYTSSAPDIISVNGNTLTANKVGTAVITASQAGDCTFAPAENITKEFTVNDKATPVFWLNNNPDQTEADLKVGESITINIENTTDALQVTCGDELAYTTGEGVLTVTALAATDNATITLTQPKTATIFSATRTFTLHITKNTATLTHNLLTDYHVDDEIVFTDLYTATNSEVEVSVLSSDEAVIKVEGDRLHAVGAGTATITISQAENYKWIALSTEQTVTVSKHANTIVWSFAGENADSKTLSYNETIAVACTSDNTDTESSPIAITQTAGEDIATYNAEQQTITASYHNGTATWTVSQPENYKYLAAEATITVTVAPQTANCYAVEDPDSHSIGWHSNSDGIEYTLNGIGETLSIDVWKENAATNEITIYGYNNSGNETTLATYSAGSLSTSASTKTVALSEDIVRIKVKAGGTLNKHFRNLYITRKQVLTPSSKTITLPTISLGNRSTQSFDLQWSTCADVIKLVSSNPRRFTLDKKEISAAAGAGTETITITYSSDVLEENATSTITIYTPYQNITLTAVGTTERKKQALSWAEEWRQDNPTIRIGETITNAVTTSAESGSLPIHYYSDNEEVIKVSDDNLSFTAVAEGSATITAKQDGNDEWAPDSVKKTFTVTAKKLQYIVWEQDFAHLTTDDIVNSIPLTAKVQVLNDKEECIDADSRTALVTYKVANENIASITADNQLSLLAEGKTTITASVPGDDTYEAVTLTMRLIIRPAADCADPLVAKYEGTIKILGKDQIGDVEMSEQPIAIDRTGGFPDKVEFQYWGEDWKLVISYFKGELRLEQSTDNAQSWKEVGTVEPERNEVQTAELPLDSNVTHIRFVCPKGGQGYQCVKDIRVLPRQFIKVVSIDGSDNTDKMPTIDFGTLGVGSKETKTFALSYSNIKSPLSLTTNAEDLKLSDNTMGYCGDWTSKSAPVTITFTPKSMGAFEGTIAIEDAKSGKSASIRVIADVSESQQFVFSTPGEWGSAENWNKGSVPGEDDEVSIGADVNIVGDVAVAGMTIFAGNTVDVKVNGKLTIGDQSSAEQEHYGNLVIENGGEVVLGKGVLKVNDFIINASTGSLSDRQPLSEGVYACATSGQLVGQNMEYQNAYIDLSFCDIQKTDQWHAMTVPFYVDVKNGVFTTDNRPLKEGVDYTFAEYNSDNRAAGKRGWQMLRSGELVPGNFYCFSGNGDIQTFRFKQIPERTLFFGKEKPLKAYATTATTNGNKGWNAVGNPTLRHGTVDFMVQTLEPTYTYAVHQASSTVFPVGVAFFIQTSEDGTMIMNEAAVPNKLRAKEEQRQQNISICVRLSDNIYTDKLYVSASEDALEEYEIGKDLVKMAMTNAPCVPQISAPYYNSNMCAVYCPFANGEVAVPLTLYAPDAGQYSLSVQCNDQVDVYLMQNTTLVWNLSAGAYDIDLAKGNTQDYKVVIRPKQQTPTEVHTNHINRDAVEKVILNQHLYVLKNGHVYDATGKLIK